MTNILVDPLNAADDVCSICLDNLNKEPVYKLPECGHKYHTNCIMHWMRSGHVNCPYCGNNGINNNNNEDEYGYNFCRYSYDLYILLRKLSRNKNAPLQLKKHVEKMKILEQKLRDNNKIKKDFLLKSGEFNEMQKKYRKLCNKSWSISCRIRRMKRTICNSNNITPLILVKTRDT